MNKLISIDYKTLNNDKNVPKVKFIQFDNQEEEMLLLENQIKDLIMSGIKKEEVTILSPFKYEKSVASKIKKYRIDNCKEESTNITYSTIQGFKGMENKVIILTDIMTYNKPDLMYVGMSRARSMLIILETNHAKKYRSKL